uniref:GST C-terminal domain-containing protein n=1 Tax=Pyrodinium bahamense TaxID=73915 RepID=A0A7S0B6Y9_9DINO|mmetsp:Transcript_528/g.1428  ORF Transcript_528/g.1428 Transcript_528/m.1428 type:complete len:125 (+) Transcript_528:190-564(+)
MCTSLIGLPSGPRRPIPQVDNLTATSSPVQRALGGPAKWDDGERRRAWQAVCAPTLAELMGRNTGPYAAGECFGAADVFIGTCCFWLHEKKGWLGDDPVLLKYFEELIKPRVAFQEAVGNVRSW